MTSRHALLLASSHNRLQKCSATSGTRHRSPHLLLAPRGPIYILPARHKIRQDSRCSSRQRLLLWILYCACLIRHKFHRASSSLACTTSTASRRAQSSALVKLAARTASLWLLSCLPTSLLTSKCAWLRGFSLWQSRSQQLPCSNTYTNKTWADVSNIDLREINRMEREFLQSIEYRLAVDAATYHSWLNLLRGLVQAKDRELRLWTVQQLKLQRKTPDHRRSDTPRARSSSPTQRDPAAYPFTFVVPTSIAAQYPHHTYSYYAAPSTAPGPSSSPPRKRVRETFSPAPAHPAKRAFVDYREPETHDVDMHQHQQSQQPVLHVQTQLPLYPQQRQPLSAGAVERSFARMSLAPQQQHQPQNQQQLPSPQEAGYPPQPRHQPVQQQGQALVAPCHPDVNVNVGPQVRLALMFGTVITRFGSRFVVHLLHLTLVDYYFSRPVVPRLRRTNLPASKYLVRRCPSRCSWRQSEIIPRRVAITCYRSFAFTFHAVACIRLGASDLAAANATPRCHATFRFECACVNPLTCRTLVSSRARGKSIFLLPAATRCRSRRCEPYVEERCIHPLFPARSCLSVHATTHLGL